MKAPFVTHSQLEMTKIGIIGYGVVGKATETSLTHNNDVDVLVYDPNIPEHSDASVLTQMQRECFAVFICLNADIDENGEQDLTKIIEYGRMFQASIATMSRVYIRSTISEKSLVKLYHSILTFFYFPEFLREQHAAEDAIHPTRLVLGSPDGFMYQALAKEVIGLFANESMAPTYITTLSEAVQIKLISNYLLAAKIVLMHDVIEKSYSVSQTVINAIACDERIGGYGFDISTGFGAGGKCLIKDLHLMDVIDESDVHQAIIKRNYELLNLSGKDRELTDKYQRIFSKKESQK